MSETIVMLHGFTQGPSSFDAVRAHLGQDVRVVAPRLPGHGGMPAARSFEDAVARLAAEIDASAGAEPVTLLAYSMGARLAVGLLVSRPERFSRALLIGARPGLPEGPERWARAQWEGKWSAMLRHEGIEAFVEAWERLPVFEGQDEAARARQRTLRLAHDPEPLARAIETMGLAAMPDYLPLLGAMPVPVLLAAGERDPKFLREAERMAAALPAARTLAIEGCGHNPVVEAPEKVARLLETLPERLGEVAPAAPARASA